MKNLNYYLILLSAFFLSSCISPKDVKYMQPSESLVINEEGLVPYNIPIYRVTKNDILKLDIITTPKGDAAQFYSTLYASGGAGANVSVAGGSGSGGNAMIYFTGLKVESKGDINIFGIGYVKAEGRTIEEISQEIQERVNENFQEGKSEVRLNTAGITYYVLGDVETTGMTGEKTVKAWRGVPCG